MDLFAGKNGRAGGLAPSAAAVREALAAWRASVNFFENAEEPELVELAVYDMEAARRRYVFLLKAAGRE